MNSAKVIRIDDDAAVAALGEKYAKAFEFLRRPDLKDLPLGRRTTLSRLARFSAPSSTSATSTSRRRSLARSSSAFPISPRKSRTVLSTRRATARFSTRSARCRP